MIFLSKNHTNFFSIGIANVPNMAITSIKAKSPCFTRTRFLHYLLVDRRFAPNIMTCFHFKFTYTTEDAPTILAHITNIMVKKMVWIRRSNTTYIWSPCMKIEATLNRHACGDRLHRLVIPYCTVFIYVVSPNRKFNVKMNQ